MGYGCFFIGMLSNNPGAFLTCVKFDCIISVVFYGCDIRCILIIDFSKRLHKQMLRVGMTLKGQHDTQWL